MLLEYCICVEYTLVQISIVHTDQFVYIVDWHHVRVDAHTTTTLAAPEGSQGVREEVHVHTSSAQPHGRITPRRASAHQPPLDRDLRPASKWGFVLFAVF